tara:strand:+ start:10350 stop:11675 length:1326 start_codon:yes stop_codon:yes gene_type:complete
MEDANLEYEKNVLVFTTSGMVTYDLKIRNVINILGNNDPKKYITKLIVMMKNFIDVENPEIKPIISFAKKYGIEWDETKYLDYIKILHSPDYMVLLNDELKTNNVNASLLGMFSAIPLIINTLKNLEVQLNNGVELSDFYKQNTSEWFATMNQNDLFHIKTEILEALKVNYTNTIRGLGNKEMFVVDEIQLFSKFLSSEDSTTDWQLLSKRLNMPVDVVKDAYNARREVIVGQHSSTLFSMDRYKRFDFALILAIQDYINYIREEISQPKPYDGFKKKPVEKDDRIQLSDAAKDYVEDCFYHLCLDKHGNTKGKALIEEDDIKYLLQANFANFGDKIPRRKLKVGLQKTHFSYFIGLMLRPLANMGQKKMVIPSNGDNKERLMKPQMYFDDIANLLKNNFVYFEDDSMEDIKKALVRQTQPPLFLEKALKEKYKELESTFR